MGWWSSRRTTSRSTTPTNAYDERDAFEQYTNRVPSASQSLCAFEVWDGDDAKLLSPGTIKAASEAVTEANGAKFTDAARPDFFLEMGEGAVGAAVTASAHFIVTGTEPDD